MNEYIHMVASCLHKKVFSAQSIFLLICLSLSEDHSALWYNYHIWGIPLLIKKSKKQRMPLKTSSSPNLCNFKHFWRQLWSTCSWYIYPDFFIQPSRTSNGMTSSFSGRVRITDRLLQCWGEEVLCGRSALSVLVIVF